MVAKSKGGKRASAAVQVMEKPRPIRPQPVHPVRVAEAAPLSVEAASAMARGRSSGETVAHYAMPAFTATVCLMLFLAAHGNVDAVRPNAASARLDYIWVIGLAVLGVAAGILLAVRNQVWAAVGPLAGVPIAFWLKDEGSKVGGYWCSKNTPATPGFWNWTEYPCDPSADIAGRVFGTSFGILAAAAVLAVVLVALRQRSHGHAAFLAIGMALTTAFGLASALLLPDLENRAQAAAVYNQPIVHTPGVEVALLLVVLVGVALARRRRRT